jgi:hypothetical protein
MRPTIGVGLPAGHANINVLNSISNHAFHAVDRFHYWGR